MRFRPLQKSLSNILTVPTGNVEQAIRDALAAINSVHGIGDIDPVRIRIEEVDNGEGEYDSRHYPPIIRIDPEASFPCWDFLHEIGHWIDSVGIGSIDTLSSESKETRNWLRAVKRSRAFRELQKHRKQNSFRDLRSGREFPIVHEVIDYNCGTSELFAHSYAYFVALYRNRQVLPPYVNTRLDAEFDRFRTNLLYRVHCPMWTEEDFALIGQELASIFAHEGWLARENGDTGNDG
jgi:hypothetical protein